MPNHSIHNTSYVCCGRTQHATKIMLRTVVWPWHGDCDSWSVGLIWYVSCFMSSRSGFLYTFCVYSPCSVNWNGCARRLVARVTIMWLAHDWVVSWSVVNAWSSEYPLNVRKIERRCITAVCWNSFFYGAMHFSANARSWDRMSSVCPSVRLWRWWFVIT